MQKPFERKGMAKAINYGVYNATNEWVLIASEDNVFCREWDSIIKSYNISKINITEKPSVITINQIEPVGPSIYNFIIRI